MTTNPRKVLVIGGTGPSGPLVLHGLIERGWDVTILHRGVHEPDDLPPVRHIHADPHFEEPVRDAIGAETFDAVIAMYGRLEMLARVFAHRCARFVGVGGRPVLAGFFDPASTAPAGMKILCGDDEQPAQPERIADPRTRAFVAKVMAAERTVFALHREGAFRASVLRYPMIYGPRALAPVEWSIVKRIADGRDFVLLPDRGLVITSRCAAANAARYVLLALERDEAAGHAFNCADEDAYSLAQWVELIAGAMGRTLRVVDVPTPLDWVTSHLTRNLSVHTLVDIAKAKRLLGYRDAVPAREALAAAVDWLQRHPPAGGSAVLEDPFDYALEDRIADALARLADETSGWRVDRPSVHMYAHPKAPSLAADHLGR